MRLPALCLLELLVRELGAVRLFLSYGVIMGHVMGNSTKVKRKKGLYIRSPLRCLFLFGARGPECTAAVQLPRERREEEEGEKKKNQQLVPPSGSCAIALWPGKHLTVTDLLRVYVRAAFARPLRCTYPPRSARRRALPFSRSDHRPRARAARF